MIQKGIPKPRIQRANTYMAALMEKACTTEPATMIQLPMKMAHLRPYVSLIQGTNGSAQMAPRL